MSAHGPQARLRVFLVAGLTGLTPPSAFAQAPAEEQPIHIVEVGSGPATVIVLHGGPGFAHQYLRPEWDVLGRHYRVVYYDQRGCGRSTRRGPYGWEQHVADLHTLVLRYKGDGPVVLAGSSWGSWLALLYAWEHPHQAAALVLSGVPPWPIGRQERPTRRSQPVAPYSRDSLPQEVRDRRDALEAASLAYQDALEAWMRARQDSMEAGLLSQPIWDSATSVRHAINLDRRLARRLGEGCPAASAGVYASFRNGPRLADLASIAVPVLIVRGTQPNFVGDGSAALLRKLPNGQMITLMGAGHDPWFERPTQFFAHVERFLQRSVFELAA